MFIGLRNMTGLGLIACLLALAINLGTAAYVYPMRPHAIDPLMLGAGNGGGAGGYGGGGGPQQPKKRPFCNAFTGCGRKRSDPELSVGSVQKPLPQPAPPMMRQSASADGAREPDNEPQNVPQSNGPNGFDDTLVDLLDLNSEPAIEDLMRQIMSQAKMWEAIQEANREMNMQKNDRIAMAEDDEGQHGQQRPRISFPTIAFNSQ